MQENAFWCIFGVFLIQMATPSAREPLETPGAREVRQGLVNRAQESGTMSTKVDNDLQHGRSKRREPYQETCRGIFAKRMLFACKKYILHAKPATKEAFLKHF